MDSPAEHAEAAEALAAWGESAIPGLRDYLRRGPQVIPQPRCFAVAMLARLHAEPATDALREVLHAHPLKTLTPSFAESEYVVKNDALEALAVRAYPERADDIAFGVRERLRAAVVAVGRMRLAESADALVDLLDDDVLADAAIASLATIGPAAAKAIAPRLDAWLTAAEYSARRRLAVIRALRVLHHTPFAEIVAIRRALGDSHPAVRAAAALLAWPSRRDAGIIDALLHGAVDFDRELADDCREALDAAGSEAVGPAASALQHNLEPDLYGQIHPLSSEQHGWLQRFIAARTAP
jgi:hypothetical protein